MGHIMQLPGNVCVGARQIAYGNQSILIYLGNYGLGSAFLAEMSSRVCRYSSHIWSILTRQANCLMVLCV
jgi:hypothetical protein